MPTAAVTVPIELGERSYPVHIGRGLLSDVGQWAAAMRLGRRALVVSHPALANLYSEDLLAGLRAADIEADLLTLPAGERHKRLSTVERIWRAAMAHRLDRSGTLIALGGGVLGDMVGFAAACYYRGVSFVQVPTTLLAMVDSSVGGKTGVNFHGKNLVGAFWQPSLVCADLSTLDTLPARQLRCGLAEVIKHGAILDLDLFERLEKALTSDLAQQAGWCLTRRRRLSPELGRYCVEQSCRLKGAVVAADERESGQRAWLNFGHTFGHALETVCGYARLAHGEAVSIGMVLAARLGQRRGDLTSEDVARLTAVCGGAGLPTRVPAGVDPATLWTQMARDKKVHEGQLRLTLLERLGQAKVAADTPPEMIQGLLAEACAEGNDAVG